MHLAPQMQSQQYEQTLSELKRLHKEKERALLKTIADQKKKMAKIEYEQKDNIRVKRIKQLEQELTQQELVLSIFEKNMTTPQSNEARRQVLDKLNDPPRTRLSRTQLEFKIKELNAIIKNLKSKSKDHHHHLSPEISQPLISGIEDSATLGGVVVAQRAEEVAMNLRIQELEQTVMKLNGMVEQLEIEVSEKEEIVERAHGEVERLKEENRRMVEIQADCEKKASQCSEQEAVIVRLREKLEENLIGEQGMENMKEIYNTRLRHANEQKRELELRLREMGHQGADKEKTIQKLRDEIQKNKENSTKEVKLLEQKIAELEQEIKNLKQEQKVNEGRDKEQHAEVTELKEENDKLRQDIKQLEEMILEQQKQIDERKLLDQKNRMVTTPVKRTTIFNIKGVEEDSARTSEVSMVSEAYTDLQEVRFEMAEQIDQFI